MVAPAHGEDARPHGFFCGEEAKHVVDGLIREGADPVEAALRRGYFVPAPQRHSVEQAAGVALPAAAFLAVGTGSGTVEGTELT